MRLLSPTVLNFDKGSRQDPHRFPAAPALANRPILRVVARPRGPPGPSRGLVANVLQAAGPEVVGPPVEGRTSSGEERDREAAHCHNGSCAVWPAGCVRLLSFSSSYSCVFSFHLLSSCLLPSPSSLRPFTCPLAPMLACLCSSTREWCLRMSRACHVFA